MLNLAVLAVSVGSTNAGLPPRGGSSGERAGKSCRTSVARSSDVRDDAENLAKFQKIQISRKVHARFSTT